MSTYLSQIMAAHRRAAAEDRRDVSELRARALDTPDPTPFAKALDSVRAGGTGATPAVKPISTRTLAVIAEIKRRSPSKGSLAPDLDPAVLAGAYAAGGATCLSVLTDRDFFGGSPEDLGAAKQATHVPVLRKDFTVGAADICDARLMGADAVLLIVAGLDDSELATLLELAGALALDALVEVHEENELARALRHGASLIGVNQRNLATFDVDTDRAAAMIEAIPEHVVAVAESGIRGSNDAARLAAAGFRAVLVGESLVRAQDPTDAVRALLGHEVGPRRFSRAGSPAHPEPTEPAVSIA